MSGSVADHKQQAGKCILPLINVWRYCIWIGYAFEYFFLFCLSVCLCLPLSPHPHSATVGISDLDKKRTTQLISQIREGREVHSLKEPQNLFSKLPTKLPEAKLPLWYICEIHFDNLATHDYKPAPNTGT